MYGSLTSRFQLGEWYQGDREELDTVNENLPTIHQQEF